MHEAGLGAYGGRREARQEGWLECARDPATGRHKAFEGRMMLVGTLEHAGGGMGNIVKARAAQTVVLSHGDRFLEIAAAVLQRGGRAARGGDERAEQRGNAFPRPGIGHGHTATVHMMQRGCAGLTLMMMGI